MSNTIKIKRGSKANLSSAGVVDGELKYTKDTKELFIGNGTTNEKIGGNPLDFPISTAQQTALDGKVNIYEVSDVTALTNAQCEALICGDVVIKDVSGSKHTYVVSYKKSNEMCLTYADHENIEEVYYEKDSAWAYTQTDITNLLDNEKVGNKVTKEHGWNSTPSDVEYPTEKLVKDTLDLKALITETGNKIDLEIDNTTFKIKAKLYDKNNTLLSTSTEIDLPLESVVVNGRYDSQTKKVVLTLQNGNTIEFSVADLISGLQTTIDAQHKLSSDLVDDAGNTNKFVTASEKTLWNAKYDKPNDGIPGTDLKEKYVRCDTNEQGLTSTEKSNARTNIGAGTYSKPNGGIPATDLAESYYKSSNPSGYISGITSQMVTTALGYTPPQQDTTYSQATSNTLGLVKVGATTTGKSYPVKLNSSGQMYVDVDWDSDSNSWRKVQLNGVDKLGNGTNTNPLNLKAGTNVTITESNGTFTFSSSYTDTNTWRAIKVNDSQVLGTGTDTNAVNFKAGTNVTITNNNGTITFSATDTTYESKTAVSGGIAVSLVTTGEKYTWNNKQNALVGSGIGQNIKTINNTSIMGSGNISVQDTLVSGTNIKTINNQSLLGNGNISVGTYSKPDGGILKTDLESAVQTSLEKADTSVQQVTGKGLSTNDFTNTDKENISNALYHLGAYDIKASETTTTVTITRQTGYLDLGAQDWSLTQGSGYWYWITSFEGKGQYYVDSSTNVTCVHPVYTATNVNSMGYTNNTVTYGTTNLYVKTTSTTERPKGILQYKLKEGLNFAYEETILKNKPLNALPKEGSEWLLNEWQKTLNLFNKDSYVPNKMINNTGTEVATAGWGNHSYFIPVKPAGHYYVNKLVPKSTYYQVICYNSSKSFLRSVDTTNQDGSGEFTVGNDVYYIIVNFENGWLETLMLNEGDHLYPRQPYSGPIAHEGDLGVKLWENGNPNSAFEFSSLSLPNLYTYKYIWFGYAINTSADACVMYQKIEVKYLKYAQIANRIISDTYGRELQFYDSNQILILDGYKNGSKLDSSIIPRVIYGSNM